MNTYTYLQGGMKWWIYVIRILVSPFTLRCFLFTFHGALYGPSKKRERKGDLQVPRYRPAKARGLW